MSWLDPFRGNLSEEDFAVLLIERLQRAGDVRRARFDAGHFRIYFEQPGRDAGYANLRNLYEEYLTHPWRDRERFFQFATRSLLASHKPLPDEFADAHSDLFLSVRSRSYFSLMELSTWVESNSTFSCLYQPLAEDLGISLVYDLPEVMVMLQASHLEAWGVTFYEAFERGLANLAEIDATFTTVDDRTYVSATGDHYDISRMLLPELIRELDVLGDPVVLLPNRDRLLVTGSDDRQGLETASLLAQQLVKQPRSLTGLAFRLCSDEWSCWLPDEDHPAYARLKALGLLSRQQDYLEQRPLLQRWLAKRQPGVSVAEFRLHGAGAKQPPTSFCVWREGESLLLPEADRVCFLRHDQTLDHPLVEGINVGWDRVQDVLGPMLVEEASIYPTRYRVHRFPTAAQLTQLQRAEAD
jgi:hypothetical protein